MRRNRKPGLSLVTTGVIALTVLVVVTYLGFTKAIPFRSHWEVTAVFKSAVGLFQPGSNPRARRLHHLADPDAAATRLLPDGYAERLVFCVPYQHSVPSIHTKVSPRLRRPRSTSGGWR